MTDGINGPVCTCGTDMEMVHGHTICPHCDLPGCPGGCPNCRKYGYHLNMRIINEYNHERREMGK